MKAVANYSDILTADKWLGKGTCSCGGTPTYKYENKANTSIQIRVKPKKNLFNLYCRQWGDWNKPLDQLQQILNQRGL